MDLSKIDNMALCVLRDALQEELRSPSETYSDPRTVEWRRQSTILLLESVATETGRRGQDSYMDEEARSLVARSPRVLRTKD